MWSLPPASLQILLVCEQMPCALREVKPGVANLLPSLAVPALMASSAPSSPLRSEDLLSESSEAPGANQVSSEVTAQLYTSLHLSRQAEATARAQLYVPSTSSPPPEALDGLAQELSRSLSVGLENNLKKKDGSKHIFEMESVRGQLQTMLQTSRETAYSAALERRDEDSFDSDSTATLLQ